jgi:hypothetical protein
MASQIALDCPQDFSMVVAIPARIANAQWPVCQLRCANCHRNESTADDCNAAKSPWCREAKEDNNPAVKLSMTPGP